MEENNIQFPEQEVADLPQGSNETAVNDDDDDLKPFKTADYVKLPFSEKLFPSIFRENITTAPVNRKVPIMLSCFAPLGAIDCRIRMRYPYDRKRLHAPLLQVVFEAPPGTGKSCFADVADQIIGPTLETMDEAQRRKEQEYRERKNARTQNEKIGEAPKTTIRCIPPATSKTVIVKRADYYKRILGDYLTFWMFAEELALLSDAGRSGFSNLRTVMRIAYDLGAKFGQDFASDNSYSGIADVQMCAMFCGTPADVDEIFNAKEVTGGGCSRVIICTLEDQVGAPPAHFDDFTPEQEENISNMLQFLMQQTYDDNGGLRPTTELDMSWLYPYIDRWRNKISKKVKLMETRGEEGFRPIDAFRKRASVNAFRCTALMYHLYHLDNQLHNEELHNEDEIRKLCRKLFLFLCDYCLSSAVNRWGNKYDEAVKRQQQGAKVDKRKPLFDQLTTVFTRDQLVELSKKNEMNPDVRSRIYQWYTKGWIIKLRKNVYQKQI